MTSWLDDAANHRFDRENEVGESNVDGRQAVEVNWDGAMTGSGRWTRKPAAASRGTSFDYGHVILIVCTLPFSLIFRVSPQYFG